MIHEVSITILVCIIVISKTPPKSVFSELSGFVSSVFEKLESDEVSHDVSSPVSLELDSWYWSCWSSSTCDSVFVELPLVQVVHRSLVWYQDFQYKCVLMFEIISGFNYSAYGTLFSNLSCSWSSTSFRPMIFLSSKDIWIYSMTTLVHRL